MSPSTPLATRQANCHPGRPRHARGLCVNCYQRARHNGTLRHHPRINFSSNRPCPCGEPGYSRGLCVWHYRWRYERSGDPAVATIPDVNHLVAAAEAARYDRRRPVATVCGMRIFPLADAATMPECPACIVVLRGRESSPVSSGGPGSAGPEVASPSADGPAGPHRRMEVGR